MWCKYTIPDIPEKNISIVGKPSLSMSNLMEALSAATRFLF